MERITKGRTNWLKTFLIGFGAGCLVVVVVFLLYRRMGPLPNLTDRELAGVTAVTSEWLEIRPSPLLRVSSKTPLVILKLEGDYAPDFGSQKLRYPDGTVGAPAVQLIDDQGNVFPLHFLMAQHLDRSGSNAMGGAGFGAADLPRDRSYSKLRIRSEKPLKCTSIIWRR
jgi:hypothetical protein